MRGILSSAPLDLVDLLFYFKGLQVIELWLVGLKFCMELILAGFFLEDVRYSVLPGVALRKDDYSPFHFFQKAPLALPYHQ